MKKTAMAIRTSTMRPRAGRRRRPAMSVGARTYFLPGTAAAVLGVSLERRHYVRGSGGDGHQEAAAARMGRRMELAGGERLALGRGPGQGVVVTVGTVTVVVDQPLERGRRGRGCES